MEYTLTSDKFVIFHSEINLPKARLSWWRQFFVFAVQGPRRHVLLFLKPESSPEKTYPGNGNYPHSADMLQAGVLAFPDPLRKDRNHSGRTAPYFKRVPLFKKILK